MCILIPSFVRCLIRWSTERSDIMASACDLYSLNNSHCEYCGVFCNWSFRCFLINIWQHICNGNSSEHPVQLCFQARTTNVIANKLYAYVYCIVLLKMFLHFFLVIMNITSRALKHCDQGSTHFFIWLLKMHLETCVKLQNCVGTQITLKLNFHAVSK